MNSTPGSFTSGRRADFVIHLGAALALGLALAASEARAGVPLPVVAEVASVQSRHGSEGDRAGGRRHRGEPRRH
jgi:hypothetical protein